MTAKSTTKPGSLEIKATIEEARRSLDDLMMRGRQLQDRWVLGLVVANGGALTALSAKVLDGLSKPSADEGAATLALVYPSMWCFVTGLILVGVAAVIELTDIHSMRVQRFAAIADMEANPDDDVTQSSAPISWAFWIMELASAACFVAGLSYPLIVLALRYREAGGF